MENEEFAPEIIFGHRRYLCPLDLALEVMGGKWKTMMIYRLRGARRSFPSWSSWRGGARPSRSRS